jgi:hypothetical protein
MRTVTIALAAAVALGGAGCASSTATPGAPAAAPAPTGVAVAAPAPPSAAPVESAARYTDPEGRFSLVPPPQWKVSTPVTGELRLILRAPGYDDVPNGAIHPVITVLTDTDDKGSDRYGLRAIVDGARQAYQEKGEPILTDATVTLADDVPAYLIGGERKDAQSGSTVHDLQLVAADNRGTVLVEALSTAKDWRVLEPDVLAALKTVRLH